MLLVTTLVVSNTGMLFPPVRTCLTSSAILKQCAHVHCFDWDGQVHLAYFDWDGQVHLPKDKAGGHQGDSLEMLIFGSIFNLTIHHLWGRVLAKFQDLSQKE